MVVTPVQSKDDIAPEVRRYIIFVRSTATVCLLLLLRQQFFLFIVYTSGRGSD